MASRAISALHPKLQILCLKHIALCKAIDVDLLVYCTYRSGFEQDQLFAMGRTMPGNKVTNCKGGQSPHNHMENGKPASLAYDCVPTTNGKAQWDNTILYEKVAEIGKKIGLTWGGNFRSIHDTPHFEIPLPKV